MYYNIFVPPWNFGIGINPLGIRLAFIHMHASMHCTQSHITHDVILVMDISLLQRGAVQYGYSQVCVFMAWWGPRSKALRQGVQWQNL